MNKTPSGIHYSDNQDIPATANSANMPVTWDLHGRSRNTSENSSTQSIATDWPLSPLSPVMFSTSPRLGLDKLQLQGRHLRGPSDVSANDRNVDETNEVDHKQQSEQQHASLSPTLSSTVGPIAIPRTATSPEAVTNADDPTPFRSSNQYSPLSPLNSLGQFSPFNSGLNSGLKSELGGASYGTFSFEEKQSPGQNQNESQTDVASLLANHDERYSFGSVDPAATATAIATSSDGRSRAGVYKRSYSIGTPSLDEHYFSPPQARPMAFSVPVPFTDLQQPRTCRNHARRSSVAIKFKHTYRDDYDDPELIRLPSPESPQDTVPRPHVHRPPSPVAERILKGEIDSL